MSYTPIVNNSAELSLGTIIINYVDPVTGNINTLVYSGVDAKTIQSMNRHLRSQFK